MTAPGEIDYIKQQIAITDMLAGHGFMPVSQSGDEFIYHSPLRNDGKPSFCVNTRTNVFKDMVVAEHRGDVIRLVQLLDNVSFLDALQRLREFVSLSEKPSFFLSGHTAPVSVEKDKIREVKYLQNAALIRYVESRRINITISRTYLHEVHYSNNNRYLYAVGFRNDSEGYALRNGVGCKRNIGPADITTIAGTSADKFTANVFEGSFDFLSALCYFGLTRPTFTTYVTNSVSNVQKVVQSLNTHQKINVYFDRDRAGLNALDTLKNHNLPVFDRSDFYAGHNDFNDFWQGCIQPPYG